LHLQYIFLILNKKKIGKERKEEKIIMAKTEIDLELLKSPIQNHNHAFYQCTRLHNYRSLQHENEILRSQSQVQVSKAVCIYFFTRRKLLKP
jgi:hypothetical protein